MPPNRALWSVLDSVGPRDVCLRCLKQARKASRDERRTFTNAASRPARTLPRRENASPYEYFWPNLAVSGSSYLSFPLESQSGFDTSVSKRQYFWPNIKFAGLSATIRGRQSSLASRGSAILGTADSHSAMSSSPGKEHMEPYSTASTTLRHTMQEGRTPAQDSNTEGVAEEDLPHRRRKKRRREEEAAAEAQAAENYTIPPDASSRLTTASTEAPASSWRRKFALYLSLSKPRLTFLIVLTTAAPYCIYPTPDLLSPAITATPSLSALTLLFLTAGTALSSASANTFNMLFEPKYDAQMSRTRNRPLVRKLISSRSAAIFGILSGCAGVAALYFGCNPTTSLLGAANIVLYAGIYTPMKRISVVNTWVGALVGAIPPLMGWTAAAGQYAADGTWRELLFTEQAVGGWLLAALLFAWQFPHFNALSHTIRHEYANAGYKMLCSVNPARNARVALRYSFIMFPICYGLAACGIVGGGGATAPTTVLWAVGSTATNGWMSYQAVRFWWWQGGKGTARSLFWASVWHLPVLLVLAMALKRGIWQRMAESVGLGAPDEDLDEDLVLLEETQTAKLETGSDRA